MLAKYGIHAGQDILLYYLSLKDGQTISELVENVCIQHATISNMISRMEASGMITKVKDKSDKRVSRIFLTEKGKEAVFHLKEVWKALEVKTIEGLTEEQKKQLKELLKHVFGNFE